MYCLHSPEDAKEITKQPSFQAVLFQHQNGHPDGAVLVTEALPRSVVTVEIAWSEPHWSAANQAEVTPRSVLDRVDRSSGLGVKVVSGYPGLVIAAAIQACPKAGLLHPVCQICPLVAAW